MLSQPSVWYFWHLSMLFFHQKPTVTALTQPCSKTGAHCQEWGVDWGSSLEGVFEVVIASLHQPFPHDLQECHFLAPPIVWLSVFAFLLLFMVLRRDDRGWWICPPKGLDPLPILRPDPRGPEPWTSWPQRTCQIGGDVGEGALLTLPHHEAACSNQDWPSLIRIAVKGELIMLQV